MSRHQPLNGVDSPEALEPRSYRVVMGDDNDGKHTVIISAAIGPRDAKEQACSLFPYDTPLSVEEVEFCEGFSGDNAWGPCRRCGQRLEQHPMIAP